MRWVRSPPVHFVALGLALFVAQRELAPADTRPGLVITAEQVAQLRADFLRQTGRSAEPGDEEVLVERAIEEELLFREARARGLDGHDPAIRFRLSEKMRFVTAAEVEEDRAIDEDLYRQAVELGFDRGDLVVRRIIVQKMRLLLAREADERGVTEVELRDYYGRHRERYAQPARVGLWHVFLAASRREGDAGALLARLRAGSLPPAAAVRLGDPFPLGAHLQGQSAHDLRKVFGDAFAKRVMSVETGSWHGPMRSSQGLHLVWVEIRRPERSPSFEAVRSRVRAEYVAERRRAHLAEALAELRAGYVVRVEQVPGERGG